MNHVVKIGKQEIGYAQPIYIVAEIGLNHNADISIAKKLIIAAKDAGCNAIKFQKRTPEKCVPPEQRDIMRDTPWGLMTYMEYRNRLEFSKKEYQEIDLACREQGIIWFASVWDEESIDFLEAFNTPCYKIPSAALTDHNLLSYARSTGRPIILSSGMSTMEQIRAAIRVLGEKKLPCKMAKRIKRLKELEGKKKILELRANSIEKQEKLLESRAEELKEEAKKALKIKQKD